MTGSSHVRPSLRAAGLFIAASVCAAAVPVNAQDAGADTPSACAKLSDVQIVQLLNRWRAAFTQGSADQLSTLYADDATLVTTGDGKGGDGKVYKGRDAIRTYFKDLFARHPMLTIRPASLAADCGTATVSGPVVYRITGERKGTRRLLGGRYKTVFEQVGDNWEIVNHALAADPRVIGEPFAKTPATAAPEL